MKEFEDYFLLFSVWNEKNICLPWNETQEWAELFGLKTVPVLYDGIFDMTKIPKIDTEKTEGYVIRIYDSFHYSQFRKSVGKYVRAQHVASSHHWKFEALEINKLKGK